MSSLYEIVIVFTLKKWYLTLPLDNANIKVNALAIILSKINHDGIKYWHYVTG